MSANLELSTAETSFFTILLCLLPAIVIGLQLLWTYALRDVRDDRWIKRTWLEMIIDTLGGPNLNTSGYVLSFFIFCCLLFPALILMVGMVLIGIYLLLSKSFLILVTSVILFVLFLIPTLVWAIRATSRRREAMMARLGQEKAPQ